LERNGRHPGALPIGLNPEQLASLRGGMLRCVEEGTARVARIPGLPYAGKTAGPVAKEMLETWWPIAVKANLDDKPKVPR
jgi:hypothetical protein